MVRWFDDEKDPPPFLKALYEARRLAKREGYCYQHVQAIIVAIDQYARGSDRQSRLLFEHAAHGEVTRTDRYPYPVARRSPGSPFCSRPNLAEPTIAVSLMRSYSLQTLASQCRT